MFCLCSWSMGIRPLPVQHPVIHLSCFADLLPNVTVRLSGGENASEGRVEVSFNERWGTICDDFWDLNDAKVICRQLGFSTALAAPIKAVFGQGSGPIWLDNVHCRGTEDTIDDCPHNGWEEHNCNHNEDASVVCAGEAGVVLKCT